MRKTIEISKLEEIVVDELREACGTRDLVRVYAAGKIAERLIGIKRVNEVCGEEKIAYLRAAQ